MQINNVLSGNSVLNMKRNTMKEGTARFSDALLSKMENDKDAYIKSEKKESCGWNYCSELFRNISVQRGQEYSGTIKPVETDRYIVKETEYGDLGIYDKNRKEGFIWELGKNQVQVDEKTGSKVLINDWGNGFFNMVAVDEELESALKEALGVEELNEKKLEGFTVNQDKKTGIKYVTANGYESRGGLIIMDNEAEEKLDSMAQEYLKQYSGLIRNYNEAWFYATFEVRGLAKRTPNGISMIGPNCMTFYHKDGEHRWVSTFDPENWKEIKEQFDHGVGSDIEEWNFWNRFFQKRNIAASLVKPDTYAWDSEYGKENIPSEFARFMALCVG